MYIYIYNFTYIYCNCTCKSNPHSECYCICDLEMQLPIVPCCQGAHNRVWQHNTVQYNTITILQYYNKASSQCINVLLQCCIIASVLVLLWPLLLCVWTPLDSSGLRTALNIATENYTKPAAARAPRASCFPFPFPFQYYKLASLQVCVSRFRGTHTSRRCTSAQSHNPRLVIFYLSLHYFISQFSNSQTVNAQRSMITHNGFT